MIPRSQVLILDATNVLARSFSKPPEARHVKPQRLFGLWTEYLASNADVVVGVFDHPGNQNKPESALFPFRSYLESRPNTMMVTSARGQAADGAIVNVARRLEASAVDLQLVTYVASGDSDLQACLAPHTFWMEILPYPTKHSPDGLVVHGVEDFRWRGYFQPSQYGVFMALRGKESVKGVGVGDLTAAKMVRAFGTVEKMLEAGQGDGNALASWDERVRRVLEDSSGRLARNGVAFGFLSGTSGDAVAERAVGFVESCIGGRGSARQGLDDNNNNDNNKVGTHGQVHHPIFTLHFDRIRTRAEEMMATTSYRVAWSVAVDGWYVDAVIEDRVCVSFVEVEDCREDTNRIEEIISQALGGLLTNPDPFKLRKRTCARSMARYLGLVKQCPRDVLLLPVCSAPDPR